MTNHTARDLERSSLRHALEQLRYERTPAARADRIADRIRRAAADRSVGHLPTCTLTRCSPDCPRT